MPIFRQLRIGTEPRRFHSFVGWHFFFEQGDTWLICTIFCVFQTSKINSTTHDQSLYVSTYRGAFTLAKFPLGLSERVSKGGYQKMFSIGVFPNQRVLITFGASRAGLQSECHCFCSQLKAGAPPHEAILVTFGPSSLIFFFVVWKLLEKYEKWHHFCAHAQWWSPWRRKNVEKGSSRRRI